MDPPDDFRRVAKGTKGICRPVLLGVSPEPIPSVFWLAVDEPEVRVEFPRHPFELADLQFEVREAAAIRKLAASLVDVAEPSGDLVPLVDLPEGVLQAVETFGSQLSGSRLDGREPALVERLLGR